MNLRDEELRDQSEVRNLHLQAFGDHGKVVADLLDDLRNPITSNEGLSLVAEKAGRIVGRVMSTPGLLDAPRRLVAMEVLSPLAVIPEFQRQGVGSALVRRGLQMLTERLVPLVFVEGSPDHCRRLGLKAAASKASADRRY